MVSYLAGGKTGWNDAGFAPRMARSPRLKVFLNLVLPNGWGLTVADDLCEWEWGPILLFNHILSFTLHHLPRR